MGHKQTHIGVWEYFWPRGHTFCWLTDKQRYLISELVKLPSLDCKAVAARPALNPSYWGVMSAPLKPTERIIWRDICRDYQGSYHSSPLSLLFHQDGKNFKDTNGEFSETFHSTTKTFEKLKVYVRNRNLSSDNALKTAHKSHSIFLALKMGSPSRSLEIRSPRSSPILTTTVTRKNCCLILSTLCRLRFWHFCKSGSTVPGYKKTRHQLYI